MAKHIYTLLLLLMTCALSGQSFDELLDAQLLSDQGSYLASNEILDNFIKANPNRLYDRSSAWFLMSNNFLMLGEFAQANAANEASITLRDRLRSEDLAENYQRKGVIYFFQGNLSQAMNYLLEASELPTDDPMLSADINTAIAEVYRQLKDYRTALLYYKSALAVLSIELDENHINIAKIDFEIGNIYSILGEQQLAKKSFKKSLKVALGSHRDLHLAGRAYMELGRIESDAEKAIANFNHALDVYARGIGRVHPDVAMVYLELGKLYLTENNWAEAKKNLQECIDLLTSVKSFINTRKATLEVAWALLAKVDLKEKKEDESALLSALSKCEAARGYFLEHYDLASTDNVRLELLEQSQILFDLGVYSAGRLYELTKEDAYLDLAFEFMELPKMKNFFIGKNDGVAHTAKYQHLVEKNNYYLTQIHQGEAMLLAQNKKASVVTNLNQIKEEYRQFQMRIALKNKGVFNALYQKSTVDVVDMQRQLSPEEVLLNYHCGTDFVAGIVLTKSQKELFVKRISSEAGAHSPAQKVIQFHEAILHNEPKTIGKIGYELYQLLVDPIRTVLNKKAHLLIIPDKYITGLPFEALPQKKPKRYLNHKYDYLVKDFTFAYTSSATGYAARSDSPPIEVEDDLLLIAPGFEQEAFSYVDARNSWLFDTTLQINPDFKKISETGESFSPLRNAILTAEEIVGKYTSKKRKVLSQYGGSAIEHNFKKETPLHRHIFLSSYTFTTHSPLLSGLVLSTDYSEDDGIVFSKEIRQLKLGGGLVTIGYFAGSPAFRLHPFYLANDLIDGGAHEVLIPLYSQYSKLDPTLNLFYERLLKGDQPASALQYVKKKLLKNKKINPGVWSAYLLIR